MSDFREKLKSLFQDYVVLDADRNFVALTDRSGHANQDQTNAAFSRKWEDYKVSPEAAGFYAMQRRWYLTLYGFETEEALAAFLRTKPVIYDAGCGLGYKAAWFAQLAPASLVIGMDFSDAARSAAETYRDVPNLFFMQGDIARPVFWDGSVDYVSCDQVIMHTEAPERTFAELSRIMEPTRGEFACYFYAKKALPRELLDDYFRLHCTDMTHDDLSTMSRQLTELGKRLSELNVSFDAPAIPALGIKGGVVDVQRFIYWNFLKCFWNPELGEETSTMTNFDWYSPSNAKRYSEGEVRRLAADNGLEIKFFHQEEACHSGRLVRAASGNS